MNIRDKTNFASYVIFAPHSFFCLMVFVFTLGAFALLIEQVPEGKSALTKNESYAIAIGVGLIITLIYWVPHALSAYARLRLQKRLDEKLDEQREQIIKRK